MNKVFIVGCCLLFMNVLKGMDKKTEASEPALFISVINHTSHVVSLSYMLPETSKLIENEMGPNQTNAYRLPLTSLSSDTSFLSRTLFLSARNCTLLSLSALTLLTLTKKSPCCQITGNLTYYNSSIKKNNNLKPNLSAQIDYKVEYTGQKAVFVRLILDKNAIATSKDGLWINPELIKTEFVVAKKSES